MQILVVTYSPTHTDPTLSFSQQFLHRVDEPPSILAVIPPAEDQAFAEAVHARAQEILQLPSARYLTRSGHLVAQIVREVQASRFDLLIVGCSQNRTAISRLMHNSVDIQIVERVPVPVIVVKGKTSRVRRILLCDSGGGRSSLLSLFTKRIANLLEGSEEITVLHVMSQISAGPEVSSWQLQADAQELMLENTPEGNLLERDLQLLGQLGIQTLPKVRHGLVLDEILDEARSGDYDLVVIGAHRGESWQRFLLEDIAREILIRTNRPVLVVK